MPREGSPGLPGNSRQGDLVRAGPVRQFCCLRNWWEPDSGRWRFGVDGESHLPVRPVAGEGYLGQAMYPERMGLRPSWHSGGLSKVP